MFFLLQGKIFPQTDGLGYYEENNPAAYIVHSHNTYVGGNCIGFAIASTQQSEIGPILGEAKSIIIDEAYAKNYWLNLGWEFYTDLDFNGTTGLQVNDILIWDSQIGRASCRERV